MKITFLRTVTWGMLCSALLLAGCSSTKPNSNTTAMAAGAEGISSNPRGGINTSGLGDDQNINGQQLANNTASNANSDRARAPFNQAYYFDFDRSTIHSQDIASIDAQANYLITHPNAKVLIAGNTDVRGSREYNIALGERRALSVADRLEMDGVSKKQIRIISYGAEKPVALEHNETAYAQNRRADLTYLAK